LQVGGCRRIFEPRPYELKRQKEDCQNRRNTG
jgi:hypothetical protein